MSWCDKLASVPGVGFLLTPHFFSGDTIIEALSPMLDGLVDARSKPTFTVNQHASFNITISTEDGFQIGVDHTRVHVTFHHKMRAKPVSGGPPIMEMLSVPKPYTKLLEDVSDRLIEVACMLPPVQGRKLVGVGVITTTHVAEEDVPPGVDKFIKRISAPWGREADSFNVNVLTVLNRADAWTDKCLHQAVKEDDPEKLLNLTFDFHRRLNAGNQISRDNFSSLLSHCKRDALDYFERIAEGNMFDEYNDRARDGTTARV
ncbi:hypothetical protein [Bradyrhizobium sp. ERR14]|uniref:hypothetical protein n=1 Tax=Bradyrhizobium sp. ERR14 TaxID=2663837 RepID=UPI0016102C9B|nr:hypothetical protein [Bradyrhizobium sp. ERR14]MBB4391488.1 hypothetical protein [Bradyrhizobium sp. ERR14]